MLLSAFEHIVPLLTHWYSYRPYLLPSPSHTSRVCFEIGLRNQICKGWPSGAPLSPVFKIKLRVKASALAPQAWSRKVRGIQGARALLGYSNPLLPSPTLRQHSFLQSHPVLARREGRGEKERGGRKEVGRQGGRPGGGGTRLANCCICSPPPSAPSEIPRSQRSGRAGGSRANREAEEATEESDGASRSSAGQELKGRTASTPAGLRRQRTLLAARWLEAAAPELPFPLR